MADKRNRGRRITDRMIEAYYELMKIVAENNHERMFEYYVEDDEAYIFKIVNSSPAQETVYPFLNKILIHTCQSVRQTASNASKSSLINVCFGLCELYSSLVLYQRMARASRLRCTWSAYLIWIKGMYGSWSNV